VPHVAAFAVSKHVASGVAERLATVFGRSDV